MTTLNEALWNYSYALIRKGYSKEDINRFFRAVNSSRYSDEELVDVLERDVETHPRQKQVLESIRG